MNKKWEVNKYNENEVNELLKECNISRLLAILLCSRGIVAKEQVDLYLSPTRKDFYDPFLMPDMQKAVDRIINAIENKEKVIIYGDYDVDGITSTTVLKQFLAERGLIVDWYIPNRLNEGYGLNKNAIKEINDKGYKLIITVDCGISALEEIKYAYDLGMEVIVTDHHEPVEVLPQCLAVVDAKRKDNIYPYNQLAGVGVVFKLIQALSIKLNLEEKEFLKFLDLVAVGTISDIVPLKDENRVIAKLGLKLVEVTKNIGLKTLISVLGFKKIDSTAISFGVAPRINASGRMGVQEKALNLFLTDNYEEAKKITQELNEFNNDRQAEEQKIFKEALEMLKKENDKSCIILGNENWHHGVIGIVASKITDMYFKPSILLCFEENEGKGSGRSIPGFDLHKALMECSKDIKKFGGHSMAIGITIEKDKFESFKTDFEKYAEQTNIKEIVPIVNIDAEISLKDLSIDIVKQLELLEPFGEANKMPQFLFKNMKIIAIRAISEGKHLKLKLKQDNYIIDAIGFNMGELSNLYQIEDRIDVVGNIGVNAFNGMENLQINIKDIRKAH